MNLSVLDYATIRQAVELTAQPSPPCPTCGHSSLGWHTWHLRTLSGDVMLVGQCLHRAHPHAPLCSCLHEQILTP